MKGLENQRKQQAGRLLLWTGRTMNEDIERQDIGSLWNRKQLYTKWAAVILGQLQGLRVELRKKTKTKTKTLSISKSNFKLTRIILSIFFFFCKTSMWFRDYSWLHTCSWLKTWGWIERSKMTGRRMKPHTLMDSDVGSPSSPAPFPEELALSAVIN